MVQIPQEQEQEQKQIMNWANSVKIGVQKNILRPSNAREVSAILKGRKAGQPMKVLGSGMSYLGIAEGRETDTILLDLSQLAGLLEDINESSTSALFGASTILENVAEYLKAAQRQMITCPGVLMTQTLAGAIATGTHGQDMQNGGIYDAVIELEVVLADGTIKVFTKNDIAYPSQGEVDANGNQENVNPFDAFRLHLGALGVITKVRLQTEPLCVYRLTKAMTDFEDLQRNYIAWNEDSEHCKAWWFPKTGDVQLWRTFKASKEEEEVYHENGDKIYQIPDSSPVVSSSIDKFTKSIDVLVEQMDADTKSLNLNASSTSTSANSTPEVGRDMVLNRPKARFDTVLRFRSLNHCLGNMYQLWCKGIPAPQVNCEIAVPLSRISEVLLALQTYYNGSGKDMHYPFILRATGPSDAWMSPSYKRSVCFIGFLVYLSEDFNGNEDRLQMLREIESVLAPFEAIPHYGKFYTPTLYAFEDRLEKWNAWKELRKRVDPEGVFSNQYLENLLRDDLPMAIPVA